MKSNKFYQFHQSTRVPEYQSTRVPEYQSTRVNFYEFSTWKFLKITFFAMLYAIFLLSCDKPQTTAQDDIDTTTLELRREPFCAKKENGNCTESDYIDKVYDFQQGTPSFPNCHFQITMKRRDCNGFIDLIYTGPVAYFSSDPDCAGFSVSSSTSVLNELLEMVFEYEYTTQLTSIPDCAPSGLMPQINFYRSSCTLRCFWIGGEGKSFFIDAPCGLSCCKNEILVCKNALGDIIMQEVYVEQPIDPCLYAFYPEEGFCPPNSYYSTSCEPRCGRILDF